VTTHVCTGNAAYRTDALRSVGLFDESLGYGYDNDMSYRLRRAGYELKLCHDAQSVHRWREGLRGYLVQQYGFGYGRLDLVAKHPQRWRGDSVSRPMMMAHPVILLAALISAGAGRLSLAAILALALTAERLIAGVAASRRFGDPIALLFPAAHLLRDFAWVSAIVNWSARRLGRVRPHPLHSMTPRSSGRLPSVVHE
jgi:cellulose synthase/poly-beta-1,6-N-acetylglucosamine synthase-like glycosyltransferase